MLRNRSAAEEQHHRAGEEPVLVPGATGYLEQVTIWYSGPWQWRLRSGVFDHAGPGPSSHGGGLTPPRMAPLIRDNAMAANGAQWSLILRKPRTRLR